MDPPPAEQNQNPAQLRQVVEKLKERKLALDERFFFFVFFFIFLLYFFFFSKFFTKENFQRNTFLLNSFIFFFLFLFSFSFFFSERMH